MTTSRVSTGLAAAQQYGWPVRAEQACPMDWDATSYTNAPHCIRRFDTGLTVADRIGEVHYDGQIWSQALWEIRQGYAALGKYHRGLGHHADRLAVRLRARHVLPGRREGDVRRGARAATARRPPRSSRTRSPARGITF